MAEAAQKKRPKSSATRAASVAAARAKETPEERREKARKAALARSPEERREQARKAGQAKSEAARKGWETRRAENPEKYGPPQKKKTAAQKKKARSEAAKKGWATRREKEARRLEIAQKLREAAARAAADWSSELAFVVRPRAGGIGSWVAEVIDVAKADAEAAGANPLARPWRIVAGLQGAQDGAGVVDVTVNGTLAQRAAQLGAAVAQGAKDAGIFDRTGSPEKKGARAGGGGRGAVALDAAAEREREAAVARFSEGLSAAQSMQVTSMVAPVDSPVWGNLDARIDDDEDGGDEGGGGFDDDEVPF